VTLIQNDLTAPLAFVKEEQFPGMPIYYSGIGIVAGGPRTMAFLVGLIANFVLAIMAVVAIAS